MQNNEVISEIMKMLGASGGSTTYDDPYYQDPYDYGYDTPVNQYAEGMDTTIDSTTEKDELGESTLVEEVDESEGTN